MVTEVVPSGQIEELVGAVRHPTYHLARADSKSQRVYILHSQSCVDHTPDLRECKISKALDDGINVELWTAMRWMDRVVLVYRLKDGLCAAQLDTVDGVVLL